MAENRPFVAGYRNSVHGISNNYDPSYVHIDEYLSTFVSFPSNNNYDPSDVHVDEHPSTFESFPSNNNYDPSDVHVDEHPSTFESFPSNNNYDPSDVHVDEYPSSFESFPRWRAEALQSIQYNGINFRNPVLPDLRTTPSFVQNLPPVVTRPEVPFMRDVSGIQRGIEDSIEIIHANQIANNNQHNMVSYPNCFQDVQTVGNHSNFQSGLYSLNMEARLPNKSWVDTRWSEEDRHIIQNIGLSANYDRNFGNYGLSDLRSAPFMEQNPPFVAHGSINQGTIWGNGFPGSLENNSGMKNKVRVATGHWTEEENELLRNLVQQFGSKDWSKIAERMPQRTAKQSRQRWNNHLKPNVKKGKWTDEEDRILIQAHKDIGNKWTEIAKRLPGRTESNVKNHWNTTKRLKMGKTQRVTPSSRFPKPSIHLQNYIRSLAPNPSKEPTLTMAASKRDSYKMNNPEALECPSDKIITTSEVPNDVRHASGRNVHPLDLLKHILSDEKSVSETMDTSGEDIQNMFNLEELVDCPINNIAVSRDDYQSHDNNFQPAGDPNNFPDLVFDGDIFLDDGFFDDLDFNTP